VACGASWLLLFWLALTPGASAWAPLARLHLVALGLLTLVALAVLVHVTFHSAAAGSRRVTMLVRVVVWTLLAVLLAAPANGIVTDDAPASGPLRLSDGSVATASDHCGDADLCATIAYANGDELSIYSEGAAYCQPHIEG